jgi:twitching motility protein PilT
MDLYKIFAKAKSLNASDIHISPSYQPRLRINGTLEIIKCEIPTQTQVQEFAYSFLDDKQIEFLNQNRDIDISFSIENSLRIRANFFYSLGQINISFRLIPIKIPILEELGLPNKIKEFANIKNGLILITGSTGSGKSTTISAMINHINNSQKKHIITLEDPVEFIHDNIKSIVSHRNIGTDTKNFQSGLKSVLREDPDVILIGEIRDQESMQMAITMAQTGHLVLTTLHTNSAIDSINRVIDMFDNKEQIRLQLSVSLKAIISQELILKNKKLQPKCEILENNQAISNLIRENKIHQIQNYIGLIDSK